MSIEEPETDFIAVSTYEVDSCGLPVEYTVVEEYPASTLVKAECPDSSCSYEGTALKIDCHNSYYQCPDCDCCFVIA